jgi:hypothetical protein
MSFGFFRDHQPYSKPIGWKKTVSLNCNFHTIPQSNSFTILEKPTKALLQKGLKAVPGKNTGRGNPEAV